MFEFPHPKDKVVILKRMPVFAACNEQELLLVAERTRILEIKKGEFAYRERDEATAFFIVISGRLRVFSQAGIEEKTLTILHNDDSFGEISLLTGERHSASVQALNDTLVLQLSKDDFDEVINKIPSLVLYLSRLLSRRLRVRERDGEFSEGTIASIYGAGGGVGCTQFAALLAASLVREARRPVVLLDLGGSEHNRELLYGRSTPAEPVALPALGLEAPPAPAAYEHPLGFRVLDCRDWRRSPAGVEAVAPLLSILSNRFAYVLIDLPPQVDELIFKALTQSDVIYFVADPNRKQLVSTKTLMERVELALGTGEHRLKIVLNKLRTGSEPGGLLGLLFGAEPRMTAGEVATGLGAGIDFVLPYVPSLRGQATLENLTALHESEDAPYIRTVRRIARQLSGRLIGLALGSGAALGLAHVGILKVLERERIPIDMVAGSSIGSLIGGLWALGRSTEDLEDMALRFKNPWSIHQLFMLDIGIPLPGIFIGLAAGLVSGWLGGWSLGLSVGLITGGVLALLLGPLVGGPIQGAQLSRKLARDFDGGRFEDTRIPLLVVAANPITREQVVFDSGPIADAVRASVSIPGIFKPVVRRGQLCLDGGVINPVPISVLKEAGANRVIAVNVFPTSEELREVFENLNRRHAERAEQLAGRSFPVRLFAWLTQELRRSLSPLVFDVIMRAMQSMEWQIAEWSCQEADLTLRPTAPGSHWLEFFHPEKFILRGEEIATQHLPELRRLTGLSADTDKP
ncbi:MAG TPA: patatin-like phospholipase family protein [bacterium]